MAADPGLRSLRVWAVLDSFRSFSTSSTSMSAAILVFFLTFNILIFQIHERTATSLTTITRSWGINTSEQRNSWWVLLFQPHPKTKGFLSWQGQYIHNEEKFYLQQEYWGTVGFRDPNSTLHG